MAENAIIQQFMESTKRHKNILVVCGSDIKSLPTPQRLPINDFDGHSHRSVDNDASEGASINLASAILTRGIAQQEIVMTVASAIFQRRAWFKAYDQDHVCLTELFGSCPGPTLVFPVNLAASAPLSIF